MVSRRVLGEEPLTGRGDVGVSDIREDSRRAAVAGV